MSGINKFLDFGTPNNNKNINNTNLNDFKSSVALGDISSYNTFNKFGKNSDISIGTEIIANFGGTFTPLLTASTLRIVSSSTADDDGGTGANSLILYGVDANRLSVIEVITLNGTSNVDTTSTWLGLNRVAIYVSGSGLSNAGNITITAITGGTTQAYLEIGEGTTQQLIYFTPSNATSLYTWLFLKANKQSGANPVVVFKGWVYSAISNSKYLIFEYILDTSSVNDVDLKPSEPFVVGNSSVFWITATTDKNATIVSGRFSLINNIV